MRGKEAGELSKQSEGLLLILREEGFVWGEERLVKYEDRVHWGKVVMIE